jgi:hypothetical protein
VGAVRERSALPHTRRHQNDCHNYDFEFDNIIQNTAVFRRSTGSHHQTTIQNGPTATGSESDTSSSTRVERSIPFDLIGDRLALRPARSAARFVIPAQYVQMMTSGAGVVGRIEAENDLLLRGGTRKTPRGLRGQSSRCRRGSLPSEGQSCARDTRKRAGIKPALAATFRNSS